MSTALVLTSSQLPALSEDGLQRYLQRINAVPLLEEEEEKALAVRFREYGDLQAAQQLVLSHLRYVARIARSYQGYGLALADLIQEGTIGLMKAVKRFDPHVGVRLASFAVHWIKAEMHEFIIRNWRIVKIATTKAQRKLFFNLRQTKKRLGWFSAQEIEEVANDLKVTPKEVREMEARLNAYDDSLDAEENEGEGPTPIAPIAYLPAAKENEPVHALLADKGEQDNHDKLHGALSQLDARSLDIIAKRWLSDVKASLKELAEHYNISIERVRQIEKAALLQLRQGLGEEFSFN